MIVVSAAAASKGRVSVAAIALTPLRARSISAIARPFIPLAETTHRGAMMRANRTRPWLGGRCQRDAVNPYRSANAP